MKASVFTVLVTGILLMAQTNTHAAAKTAVRLVTPRTDERTGFQDHTAYRPELDLRNDFIMVYSLGGFEKRADEWKARDYIIHLMTGSAWGGYHDFRDVNGSGYMSIAQVEAGGEPVMHGKSSPYIVPTVEFSDYLSERIRKAIDAGAVAIHLEEPEYWAHAGFSEPFKREWELYYREPYVRPDTDVNAQYKASRLKYYLYGRELRRIAEASKEYAMRKYNRVLRFYVPTHSLINYTQWRIISPQSSLVDMPVVDGFIAQIWTGTSRSPNVYHGVRKERTFETAFLEYGVMQELTRGTGRRMWFLHDPIEDNGNYGWDDYRYNYKQTLIASLLHPDVWHYEICPWVSRVILRTYPRDSKSGTFIPDDYLTTLCIVFNQFRDMEQSEIEWPETTEHVGVFVADSGMFQRAEPAFRLAAKTKDDPAQATRAEIEDWSSFYGLALPLVKYGVPARPVQLDNISRFPGYIDDYKVLVLSYEFLKPLNPSIHQAIGRWVRAGGALVYVGAETDPFHEVAEWWNGNGKTKGTCTNDLLSTLGLESDAPEGRNAVGKGSVFILRKHPAALTRSKALADEYRQTVRSAVESAGLPWVNRNSFLLRRGPYVIAACMDESVNDKPLTLSGRFVNIFDAELSLLDRLEIKPGEQAWLMDLDRIQSDGPEPLASAGRIETWTAAPGGVEYTLTGPAKAKLVTRLKLPAQPDTITLNGGAWGEYDWDAPSGTLRIRQPGSPDTVTMKITWKKE